MAAARGDGGQTQQGSSEREAAATWLGEAKRRIW